MDFPTSQFSAFPAGAGLAPSMTTSRIAVTHSPANHHRERCVTTSIVGERVCAFLRKKHPQRTAENVSADLYAWKISTFTIRNMLERQTAPGAVLWCALIETYGPDFLSAALPRVRWLDEAAVSQRKAALAARIDALKTEMERL